MTANQRSGVIASIRRRSRRTTSWSTSAWSKYVDEPARPYGWRHVAQRGAEVRPGPLAHGETFGKLPFGLLRNPLPGLVRGKECARVLADCSGERDRCHLLPNLALS